MISKSLLNSLFIETLRAWIVMQFCNIKEKDVHLHWEFTHSIHVAVLHKLQGIMVWLAGVKTGCNV